jgi:hypothetical protein
VWRNAGFGSLGRDFSDRRGGIWCRVLTPENARADTPHPSGKKEFFMSTLRIIAASSLMAAFALAHAQTATTPDTTSTTTTSTSTTTVPTTTTTTTATPTGPLSQGISSVNKNLERQPDNKGLQNAAERLRENRERQEARRAEHVERVARVERVERPERPERPEKIERPEKPEKASRPGR